MFKINKKKLKRLSLFHISQIQKHLRTKIHIYQITLNKSVIFKIFKVNLKKNGNNLVIQSKLIPEMFKYYLKYNIFILFLNRHNPSSISQ